METSLGLYEECSTDFLAKPRLNPCTHYSENSDEQTGHKRLLQTGSYDSRERI